VSIVSTVSTQPNGRPLPATPPNMSGVSGALGRPAKINGRRFAHPAPKYALCAPLRNLTINSEVQFFLRVLRVLRSPRRPGGKTKYGGRANPPPQISTPDSRKSSARRDSPPPRSDCSSICSAENYTRQSIRRVRQRSQYWRP